MQTGTAHQAQQQGLGLVILVMCQQQRLVGRQGCRQRVITRPARSCLEAGLVGNSNAQHPAGHAGGGRLRHGLRGPGIGIGMQTMVNMQGTQAQARLGHGGGRSQQKGQGIGAAAEGDHHAGDAWRVQATRLQELPQGADRVIAVAGAQATGRVLP